MAAIPPSAPKRPASEAGRARNFLKYSGLGAQMLAVIGLSAWAGLKLDAFFYTRNPWYTVGLMLAGVLAAMYQLIRSVTRES